MLEQLVMWVGRFPVIYKDETREWVDSVDALDKTVIDASDLPFDENGLVDKNTSLMDDSGDMFGEKLLLIRNCQLLMKNTSEQDENEDVIVKRQIPFYDMIKYLKSSGSSVHLGVTFQNGMPVKKVTDLATDYRERLVPFAVDDMAEWMVDYLKKNKILISRPEATKIAEYVGDDVSKLVQGLQEAIGQDPQKRVTADELLPMMGTLGSNRNFFALFNAMIAGDVKTMTEYYYRTIPYSNVYALHAMLLKKLMSYALIKSNPNITLETLEDYGVYSNNQLYYAKREARRLSENDAYRLLSEAEVCDIEMKGGSAVPADTTLLLFMTSAARAFASSR